MYFCVYPSRLLAASISRRTKVELFFQIVSFKYELQITVFIQIKSLREQSNENRKLCINTSCSE